MKELAKNKAVIFYFTLVVIVFLILLIRDFIKGVNNVDWNGIWVEMHGVFFDIVILGFLLAIYDHYRNRKEKIDRYLNEIDDFRMWNDQEATQRIRGNIRRLVRLGINEINLDRCFLFEVAMSGEDLSGSSFLSSNLEKGDLTGVNFSNVKIQRSNFRNTCFVNSEFSGALIESSDFEGCDLRNSNLDRTNFIDCNLISVDFRFADLRNTSFENVIFDGAKMFHYQKEILEKRNVKLKGVDLVPNPDDFDLFKDYYINGKSFEVYKMKMNFNNLRTLEK